ncbi:Transferase [Arabidopsis thaliana x Arabidopsis arenosa]|uniref:Transferase n=1 Tax=Arabidopsis thaliana x Arabidopsis arenosa TaxID=1240361 RepID=A0A8T1Y201_9BRAS|nr:Transferase [Arabidopsis thaliana x Arabidopsis arenosa]
MEEDRVRFICKRTVVSTRSMEPGRLYRFSVLDHVMEPNHIRLVYYYRSSKTREPGEITKKLRESLAYALNCYPIVTGRLVKEIDGTEEKEDVSGRWKVKSNDAGMRMVEARATGSVEEWLRNVNREEELKLVHWEDMYHLHYYWSTFCVQVTEFESGGLAIGLSCSHLLADPVCAMMFIRAWADLTLSRSMMAPPLFHPLPPRRFANHRLISNNQLVSHYIKSCSLTASPSNVTEGHMVTVTFLFPDPLVRAGENEPRISTFEILAGLFWVCVSRAKGKRNELMDMSLCLDVRKLLRLDQGYFGNCMVYHKVPYSKPVKTKDTLLIHAVQEIENITKKLDYDTVMDLIEWLSSSNNGAISNGSDLVCTNLENMSYSRPMMFEEDLVLSHVSCYVEGPVAGGGQVIVLPSPPGKGPMSRVVMVSLPQREMVKVVEDELLLSFSPVVIMENTEQI